MMLKLKTTRCKQTKSAAFRMVYSCRAAAALMMTKMRTLSQWWTNNTVNLFKRTSSRQKPWRRMHIKFRLIQTRTVSRPSKFKTKWAGYVHRAPKRCPQQSNNKLSFNNSSRCRSTWWTNSICKVLLWASGSTRAWCNNNSSKWTMPSNSKCLRISKCSILNKWVVLVSSSCLASLPSADRVQPDARHSSISVRSSAYQDLRMSQWVKLRALRTPRRPARSTLRCISCVHEWSIKSANASTTM